jgi:hypothetical protein
VHCRQPEKPFSSLTQDSTCASRQCGNFPTGELNLFEKGKVNAIASKSSSEGVAGLHHKHGKDADWDAKSVGHSRAAKTLTRR